MRRFAVLTASIAATAALAVPAVSSAATNVGVKLSDFKLTPSTKTARSGKVTFKVTNTAGEEHELVVIKTPTPAAKLPTKGGMASEKGSVGEAELGAHKSHNLTLNLKRGHYALICNMPGHFGLGMRADFTVR
jgi:uncharacterized cupredoxin-like copper-binding protein